MTLNTCGKDDCKPVEQIRGEMGPGDYRHVWEKNEDGIPELDEKFYTKVDLYDDIKDDFRVCCMKCGKALPWNSSPTKGLEGPDAAAVRLSRMANMRERWNALVA